MIDIELNIIILSSVILYTVLCWYILCRNMNSFVLKVLFLLVYIFFCLYCGCGIAIVGCNMNYSIYYFLFVLVMTLVLKVSVKERNNKKFDSIISYIIDKYGNFIIIFYLALQVLTLLYPEYKLHLLLNPPTPDVNKMLAERGEIERTLFESLIYYLSSILLPFFYLSLYKYNKEKKIVSLILAINLYIHFCSNGNIGRSLILSAILIVILSILQDTSPQNRKKVIFYVSCVMPIFFILFYFYSQLRIGEEINNGLSFSRIVGILFSQEISFPLWFDDYKDNFDVSRISEYLQWLCLLPLPNFLKFGNGNQDFNADFTYEVLGVSKGDEGFYIILPGLLGESYFIFGQVLMFVAAIIYSFIVAKVFNFLSSNRKMSYLLYYYAVLLSFIISRGGSVAVYPLIVKHMLTFIFVFIFIRKIKQYN